MAGEFICATFPTRELAKQERAALVAAASRMGELLEAATGERVEPDAEDCFRVLRTDDGFAVICTDPSL